MEHESMQETGQITVREVLNLLGARAISSGYDERTRVEMACAADLMSDVLAFIKAGALLLTGLTTPQVIYTAEMADVRIVCFVRGKQPSAETIALAEKKHIILLQTSLPMFESCGRLHAGGVRGCSER
jgi:hypothetical protein